MQKIQDSKILVVGASGVVGSEIVRLLLEQGMSVRTTTSKIAKTAQRGVEQVVVDLHAGKGIRSAFEGVDRAFLLSPSGFGDQYRILSPLIQEAKRRGLKKVVLMTAMGANAVDATPLRRAELDLEKSGLNYNIIRPNWFLQNFHTFWVQGIREQSAILLPAGKAKVSFIDTRDIAAVATKLLVSDELNNQAFDLTGPTSVDHDEVAKALSVATGKPIVYKEIEPETLRQGLLSAGLPADYTDFLILIFGFLRDGYNARVNNNVQKIVGREPYSLTDYAQLNKNAWL